MKKILSATCAMMLASAGMMANAQQLPNVGFDGWKTTNGTTILTSTDSKGSQVRPGSEPEGWNASNINQIFDIKTLCEKKEDSGNVYVQLKNTEMVGNVVPAYLTLGTPWVFAHGSGFSMMTYAKYGDGGSFSGQDNFRFKPDAISFKYRKSGNTEETSHVIAYLWNGSFSSNVPTAVTKDGVYTYGKSMQDVDRVVIGNQNDENVTVKGKLIASLDFKIAEDKQDWTSEVVEFEYVPENLKETPSKMNVVISASDYWTRSNLKGNTQLDIDDVKFVYYSRLASITLNGEAITLEEGKYDYTVDKVLDFSEDKVVPTVMGKNAKAEVSIDFKSALVTVEVSNVGVDSDGKSSHTYTFQYQKPVVEEYTGYLNVEMGGSLIEENATSTIEILDHQNDYCTFLLPNLTIGGTLPLGDIRIFNVVITSVEGGNSYAGTVDDMILHNDMLGDIHAKVVLNGTIIGSDVKMDVDVIWYPGYPNKEDETPIKVSFTSAPLSGVESVAGDGVKVYAAAGCVVVEGTEGVAQVYTVDGKQVAAEAVNGKTEIVLANGLYIVRVGNKVQKVVVK